MEEKKQFLLVMDVPSIKKYVFGTDRLIEIRGASALLDDLNRKQTELFMQRHLVDSEIKCVFANGGSAQFLVKAKEGDLNRCLHALEAHFYNETKGGARLVCGKAVLTESGYQSALHRARLQSEKISQESAFVSLPMIHTGFMRECDSCSGIASQIQKYEYEDEQRILCETCYKKASCGKESKAGLWQDFADYLTKNGIKAERPKSFEEIAKKGSAPREYTALVYADGNGMGKLIREIKSWEQFEFFSETIDAAIRTACHEALHEVFWGASKKKWKTLPAEILLVGGDDLLVYLTADKALPFAIMAAEKFSQKTRQAFASSPFPLFKESLGSKGATISIGIAVGKSHTPFSLLLTQAEDLLASAKRKGARSQSSDHFAPPTYIDYHFTSYFNQISVEDSRKNHLELQKLPALKKIRLFHKPYSLEETKDLLSHAQKLSASKIPRTRLKRLGFAPALGKMNGTLECLKLYMRTGEKNQKALIREALLRFDCFQNMPWNEKNSEYDWTMLVDLMELTDLISTNVSN